jgi:hypothetical protein
MLVIDAMSDTSYLTPFEEMKKELEQLRFEHENLRRQILAVRRELQRQDEWLDTVNSPWIKRIWWFFQGYRYHRLGRWYGD